MFKKRFITFCLFIAAHSCVAQATPNVTVTPKDGYYIVKMDLKSGNYYAAGKAYGQALKKSAPHFQQDVNRYVNELIALTRKFDLPQSNETAAIQLLKKRVRLLKHNIPKPYQQEIAGLAHAYSSHASSQALSFLDKLYLVNSDYDVLSPGAECTMFSAFGPQAAGGGNIIGRIYDFDDHNAFVHMHAVFIVRNPNGSVTYSIGFLPVLGTITGFNSHNLYLAFLEADTPTDFANKTLLHPTQADSELHMAMRYALDHYSTAQQVIDYFKKLKFTRGILMTIGTPEKTVVLEKQVNGAQAVRTDMSAFNQGHWQHPNMIAAINTFFLKGSPSMLDSKTFIPSNPHRWQELTEFAHQHQGQPITEQDVQTLLTTHTQPMLNNDVDIYNQYDLHIVITKVGSLKVHVFFAPVDGHFNGPLPAKPAFKTIDLGRYNHWS